MATAICESFEDTAERLVELGLCYLSLDRAGATLSTGERTCAVGRSVRNRTTGVLYVLDETVYRIASGECGWTVGRDARFGG